MHRLAFSFAVLALVASATAEITTYENFKVYQAMPESEEQAKVLLSFKKFGGEVDFWSELHALNHPVDIMVAPRLQEAFVASLEFNGIKYHELISNVESVFQQERLRQAMAPKVKSGRINFVEYHRYSVIESYLQQLAEDYPDIVRLRAPAVSSQNRTVYMLRISSGGHGGQGKEGGPNHNNKPSILIDGGIHAREWVSPTTVLYIINQLVENPANRDLLEHVNFFIIPMLNPDGYEFTHTNTRLWRKTRSQGKRCIGVDGNRNFDFHWMEVGASSNECDDTYAGPKALSEPEMNAIKHIVEKHGDNIKLYLTFHSYGQYLLYPWGYTSALPENWKEHDDLAHNVDKAISAVAGTKYTIGSSTNVLYAAAGGSDDYVKGVGGVPLAFTLELPAGGVWGFDPPTNRIHPIAAETFEGVKVFIKYIAEKYGNSSN